MSLLTAFTNQLSNLMNELHELYPNDRDMRNKENCDWVYKKNKS